MNGNYHHPPPHPLPFPAAGPRHLPENLSFCTPGGTQFPANGFAPQGQKQDNGFLNSDTENHYYATNLDLMSELESQFSGISLLADAQPTVYDVGSSSSGNRSNHVLFNGTNGVSLSQPERELRDIRRMRVQSAARSYMHPQFSDFENSDDCSMQSNPNMNRIWTSNQYNNSPNNVGNLNGYSYNQHHRQSLGNGYSSRSYDLGVDRFLNPGRSIVANGGPNGHINSLYNGNRNGHGNSHYNGNGYGNGYGDFCRSMSAYNGNVNGNDTYQSRSMLALDRTPAYLRRPRPRWSNITSLEDIRGRMFLVSRDQHGCRFLQQKVEEGNHQDIRMIIDEIKDHICEVMVDQFGNYLFHKILAACNEEEISELLLLVIRDDDRFKDICIDLHGTRSVQKLLEFLTTEEQISQIVSVLRRITLPLTKSMNGHHVIQYCLKNFSVQDNMHILKEVADNCIEIALDKSGCCVLQQCVEHAEGQPKEDLIDEITSNALLLAEHPYGNYVVQYILGLKIPDATDNIMKELSGSFVGLSMSKYGSNVVEKFLKDDPEASQVVPIIQELTSSPSFLRVLQDPYGNYVAQSAFRASRGEERIVMMKMVLALYPSLHSHPHGKRVYSCIRSAHAYMY